jgi:hypothetical protein
MENDIGALNGFFVSPTKKPTPFHHPYGGIIPSINISSPSPTAKFTIPRPFHPSPTGKIIPAPPKA